MQHAILQVMKCMMAIKGIDHQGQRLSWQISSPSAITARWSSGAANQPATIPMIAFDPLGATTQSADQNSSSTQVINRISGSIYWIIEISRNSGHATAACVGALSFPPRTHALSTSLPIVVSRLELPLTLAHIIGDVKGTVLHDSTLMGQS
ncbi:hypothetical protein F511_30252 [Dorcoceras hygrometricum]|uniref:Uncharacterized protein n=1 Tax=Dorcoceras hygrometricum TaxID=472368 RepID=A0A2Z7AG56_9LAMI|nr:hypothetical protein F511_30252 [Dorcoceras hygrometricum]